MWFLFFFFKQKTAYEMRISDWSSDVCSSDLPDDVALACGAVRRGCGARARLRPFLCERGWTHGTRKLCALRVGAWPDPDARGLFGDLGRLCHARTAACRERCGWSDPPARFSGADGSVRSEEHTSELQSLMRISYAVFCLKKKK